ncbi:MAG: alcohol dehydrogenase catalytic domain-containing protein [Candidatus Hodarchaeales archaeon]
MKAAVFDGKQLLYKEVSDPICESDQVLIKIKAVSICGTDIAIVNGDLKTPLPIIPGHEFVGVVEECGKRREHIKSLFSLSGRV